MAIKYLSLNEESPSGTADRKLPPREAPKTNTDAPLIAKKHTAREKLMTS